MPTTPAQGGADSDAATGLVKRGERSGARLHPPPDALHTCSSGISLVRVTITSSLALR